MMIRKNATILLLVGIGTIYSVINSNIATQTGLELLVSLLLFVPVPLLGLWFLQKLFLQLEKYHANSSTSLVVLAAQFVAGLTIFLMPYTVWSGWGSQNWMLIWSLLVVVEAYLLAEFIVLLLSKRKNNNISPKLPRSILARILLYPIFLLSPFLLLAALVAYSFSHGTGIL